MFVNKINLGTLLILVAGASSAKGQFKLTNPVITKPAITNPVSVTTSGTVLSISGSNGEDNVQVFHSRGRLKSATDDSLLVRTKFLGVNDDTHFPLYRYTKSGWQIAIDEIRFDGYGGDDQFVNHTSVTCTANGGPGNDLLEGGNAGDTLNGNDGEDVLIGNEGDDVLSGGPDADLIDGGADTDTLYGYDREYEIVNERSDVDTFVDQFQLDQPVFNGTHYLDVDQQNSSSCTILSALSSAAHRGVDLANRIVQDDSDPTLFYVSLFDTDGVSEMIVPVEFDGTWTSNDCPPTRKRGVEGRPTGAIENEFWALLYQRAYLEVYVPNWRDPNKDNWQRVNPVSGAPVRNPGSWGLYYHPLRSITGGIQTINIDTRNPSTPILPSPEEIDFAIEQGDTVVCTTGGHVVALLDMHYFMGTWIVEIYNQRALDNYVVGRDSNRRAFDDGVDDGRMFLLWESFEQNFYVVCANAGVH